MKSPPLKSIFPRDIPPRAAAVVIVVTLLASVVVGQEQPSAPSDATARMEPRANDTSASSTSSRAAALRADDLDIDRLARARQKIAARELFESRSWAPPAPIVPAKPAVPAAPPVPVAPALPFRYLGRMIDGNRAVVFLARDQDVVTLAAGESFENTYRIDSITESEVKFTYLPLGTAQTLAVPSVQ